MRELHAAARCYEFGSVAAGTTTGHPAAGSKRDSLGLFASKIFSGNLDGALEIGEAAVSARGGRLGPGGAAVASVHRAGWRVGGRPRAGIGKTVLFGPAVKHAGGPVLTTTGGESEAVLPRALESALVPGAPVY